MPVIRVEQASGLTGGRCCTSRCRAVSLSGNVIGATNFLADCSQGEAIPDSDFRSANLGGVEYGSSCKDDAWGGKSSAVNAVNEVV